MSLRLDLAIRKTGTRFRLYPQPAYLDGFGTPEEVTVVPQPSQIQAGPRDDRFVCIDAPNKRLYDNRHLPPYQGPANPPVAAGPDGHFDHLAPGTREFRVAHMYATVRRVLDIWQDYFGGRIEWHFAAQFERMELIPLVEWDNAHSGWGFLEFGYGGVATGGFDRQKPYCVNFDVLAHELGHSIVFSKVGIPSSNEALTFEYGGFHESAGDLVAIVASLHFDRVVDLLLRRTRGNLFTANELSRVGELSQVEQIRTAFNWKRMSTVSSEPHDLSEPLTGALFDILVEVYQKQLVKLEAIPVELGRASIHGADGQADPSIQRGFDTAYPRAPKKFAAALLIARDYLGQLLARTWEKLPADHLSYADVARRLLLADREHFSGFHQETIRSCFAWREIGLPASPIALRTWRLSECGLAQTAAAPLAPAPAGKKPAATGKRQRASGGGSRKLRRAGGNGARKLRSAR